MPHYIYMLLPRVWHSRNIGTTWMFRTVILLGAVMAITSVLSLGAQSAAISQGYKSDGSLAPGALVSLEAAQTTVTAADSSNSNGLFGIVVGNNTTPLAVNSTANLAQVTTNGTAQAFVSDINGPIKAGDPIAPSPIRGVGMKVLTSGKVVGTAQHGFDSASATSTVSVKTASGGSQQVHLGSIPIAVQVTSFTVTPKGVVPNFIQLFAISVTGKTISVVQLTVVLIILGAALIVVGILMFAAVRGSIVSLGRNPLAASSIYRGTFQAVAASMAILGVAVLGAYMVLRY